MAYNWQHPDWPDFRYDLEGALRQNEQYAAGLDALLERYDALPINDRQAAALERAVEEGYATASIEGEVYSRDALRSSLLNHAVLGTPAAPVIDRRANATAELLRVSLVDPTAPVTETALKYWHETLFRRLPYPGTAGTYRSGTQAMQIVGGSAYAPTVYFEAPPAREVPDMMETFVAGLASDLPPSLHAAIAHVHFESIHPFSDGNGRIGRALIDYQLAAPFGRRLPLSVSSAFLRHRSDYYAALRGSQSSLDITPFVAFFYKCLLAAVDDGRAAIEHLLRKRDYFRRFGDERLTPRQRKALLKMWDAGPAGFTGGMSTRKYVRITGASAATAQRDLTQLHAVGALVQEGRGRSTRYVLPPP